jgi:hypothetical protein
MLMPLANFQRLPLSPVNSHPKSQQSFLLFQTRYIEHALLI